MTTLSDLFAITSGTNFLLSAHNGDILRRTLQGFYSEDTRVLSEFRILINGRAAEEVGWGQLEHSLGSIYAADRPGRGLEPPASLSVVRDRYIGDSLHEDISIKNHSLRERRLRVSIVLDADFADLFEVRAGRSRRRARVIEEQEDGCGLVFSYRSEAFSRETRVVFSEPPLLNGRTATYNLVLQPQQVWRICVEVLPTPRAVPKRGPCAGSLLGSPFASLETPAMEGAAIRESQTVPAALQRPPELETDIPGLRPAFEVAVRDLRSLLIEYLPGRPIFAAGLPWFMAVFGRDSVISALQTKLLGPEPMIGTLATLAHLQAQEFDEFREAEPGKIPHEIRKGELSALSEGPHSRYYGSVDATPLFVRLLWDAYQWTGSLSLLEEYLPAAEAAIGWIDRHGDIDGDGFIEYGARQGAPLRNQGWKDSGDGISFADGRRPRGPIALAEVQGYAYAAKVAMARVYAVLGRAKESARLEEEAEELRRRFDDAFWMAEEGCYAVALDGAKRKVDSITSNAGQCLWTGIVPEERAAALVERLMAPDMFSGWGIRTLSSEMARYNPLSYHNGTVWPHDNSLIAAGMLRYGQAAAAFRVALGVLQASSHFSRGRMPELFAGYPRRALAFPVPYPLANAPQAWACGAVIYFVETLLGVSVAGDRLLLTGSFEKEGRLGLRGVRFREMWLNL
jgi:glycogen debranching enzyme